MLSTVVGVPILLMLVLAITLVDAQPSSLPSLIAELCRYLSWPGLLGCAWVLASFSAAGRGLRSPFRDLYLLIWVTALRCLLTLLPCPAALLLLASLAQRTLTLHLALTTLLRRRFGPTSTARLWARLTLACLCFTMLALVLCVVLLPAHSGLDPLASVPLLLPRLSPVVLTLSLPSFMLLLAIILLLSGLRLPASMCGRATASQPTTRGHMTTTAKRDTGFNLSNGSLAIVTSTEVTGDTIRAEQGQQAAEARDEVGNGQSSPTPVQDLMGSSRSVPFQTDVRGTLNNR